MKERLKNIFAVLFLGSTFLPIAALKTNHDCRYDECLRILSNYKLGACVQKSIDDLYFAISVIWYFVIIASCMVLYHKKVALSPYIIMATIIAFCVWGAFLDNSKWIFVVSLLPSLVLLIIANILDNKSDE